MDTPPASYEASLNRGLGTLSNLASGAADLFNAIQKPRLEEKRIQEPTAATQFKSFLPWIIGGVVTLIVGVFLIKALK